MRIIVSSTKTLADQVKQGRFSRHLYAQLNYLQVKLPSLHERREDLSAIIEQLTQRHRLYQEQSICDSVVKALCNYHWPENYQQLESTIARLLALGNHNPINLDDLAQYAPEINQSVNNALKDKAVDIKNIEKLLIPNLMQQNYEPFKHLHSGLQKALKYLGENYCKEITLTQLAQNAFVSPSHLSYLLKFYLGHSFKQILARLRIEKAKQLFDVTPNSRITDVSLDVGFGDLSHFEKIFKRYTQVTPRQYKNGVRESNGFKLPTSAG